MILRRLELSHFGRFGERVVEFHRGMNLVSGPNEAGKSTLMEAIPAVLFGARQKERFRPWGRQGSCSAALQLESGSSTVRIQRELLSDRVLLTETDELGQMVYTFEGKVAPQGRSSERVEYLEQLARWLGNAEEDLFRASLFFGQGQLEIADEQTLSGRIKTLLSGFVDVDYDQVLASLQEDYFNLTKTNPWGKDKTRNRELDDIRLRIDALETSWYQARESLKDLAEVQAELHQLEGALATGRADYDQGAKYLAWARRQWQLEEKEEGLRRDFSRVQRASGKVEDLEQERRELLRELGKTGLPLDIPGDLPLLLGDAEKIRKELVGLQVEAAAFRKQLLELSPLPWQPAWFLSALFLGVGLAGGWYWSGWFWRCFFVGLLLIVSTWGAFLWRAWQLHAERSLIKGRAQVVENRREGAQDRLVDLDEQFHGLGLSPSAVEIVRMQKNLERHSQLVQRLSEVESALKVLDQPAELNFEKENLTRELVVLSEKMERDKPLRGGNVMPPEDLPEAEEKLQALGRLLQEQDLRLLELTRREASLLGEMLDLQKIEEEGERLRERETLLSRRKDALAAGYELLREAVGEYRQTYLERFSTEIGYHLAAASHGRYTEVRLDDDFILHLCDKVGRWHPLSEFSRGTIDASYFAIRLALARHLAQGRRLPLLLDDPLVNLDRFRLADALRLLERLSSEHQIILFSHNEGLLKKAVRDRWHVVSLEGTRAALTEKIDERNDDGGQLCLL